MKTTLENFKIYKDRDPIHLDKPLVKIQEEYEEELQIWDYLRTNYSQVEAGYKAYLIEIGYTQTEWVDDLWKDFVLDHYHNNQ